MKVSSIFNNSIESCFIPDHQGKSILYVARNRMASLLKTMDHIGTAIALGEKADLDAADKYRNQPSEFINEHLG